MPPPIEVDPAAFHAASTVFGQDIAQELVKTALGLLDGLAGSAAMAGSDTAGITWAHAYDRAAGQVVGAFQDVTNGCYQLAALLRQTGFNHGAAEAASDPRQLMPTPADTWEYEDFSLTLAAPPSAVGGSGSPPAGWGVVAHLVGYAWPNGHQDRLRAAAGAWSAAADQVSATTTVVPEALQAIATQSSPEVPDAFAAAEAMGQHLSDLAGGCQGLAGACNDFAGHIDAAHHSIEHELISLVEWTAGIEAGGFLVGLFTFGGGEGAAQAVEAGRIAATAARIGRTIAALIEAAGAATRAITEMVGKVLDVSRALKTLLGARLARATLEAVDRLPGVARTAEQAAEEDLEAAAAARDYLGPDGLPGHEAAGGHTLARHVGMSDSELQARVAANPNIAGASTFPSRAVAESSIRDVLNANSSQIQNWLSGSGGKLTLNGHMAEPIGRYVAQGSGSVVDVSGVRVILVRDSNMQLGYRIQTAFPTP